MPCVLRLFPSCHHYCYPVIIVTISAPPPHHGQSLIQHLIRCYPLKALLSVHLSPPLPFFPSSSLPPPGNHTGSLAVGKALTSGYTAAERLLADLRAQAGGGAHLFTMAAEKEAQRAGRHVG